MRISNLSKTYRLKSGEVRALNDVNMELPENGTVFILGKSGSGKTTLLNLLSGLDSADEGSVIEVGGKNIVTCSRAERDGYRNSHCGFVFQEYNLIPELDVKENVGLSLELQGNKDNKSAVENALKLVELEGYGNRKITELSGGQKQRVAIARAIVKDPKIVFADEPTGALDSDTGEMVMTLLKNISKDRLVIIVSHDKEFAEKYGDRIIELSDGKVISDGDGEYSAVEQKQAEFKKPKLPLKTAFKMGSSTFRAHPIRLVFTLLLSVMAFTLLGVAVSASLNSYENILYNAMIADGAEYSAVYGYNAPEPIDIVGAADVFGEENTFGVVRTDGIAANNPAPSVYDSILPHSFAVMTEQKAAVNRFTILGRLPTRGDELCITAFSADIIGRVIFGESEPESIVGKVLTVGDRDYTVVGIIDTRFDAVPFDGLKNTTELGGLAELYSITLECSVHNLMFVSELGECDLVVIKNTRAVTAYLRSNDRFRVYNATVQNAEKYTEQIKRIGTWSGVLAAVFGVFATLLLLNFLLQSFTDRYRSLGILKANGANTAGLFKVFFCEAAVISGIVFILSSIITVAACECMNAVFGIAFFGAYYFSLPLLFCAVAAIGLVGCVLPLRGIMRMTSIEVINRE